MKKVNRIGQRYGRLVVVSEDGSKPMGNRRRVFWNCLCDCGNTTVVESSRLQSGNTGSCGCLKKESIGAVNYKHGEARKTKEYRSWAHLIGRCTIPTDGKYPQYGGRGIKVCERWLNSYTDFLQDMGRAPSPKHSIERINVNGDYEPSNCKWATMKEQGQNTTKNVVLELNGEVKNLKQWAETLGYEYRYFHAQIQYKGKSLEELAKKKRYKKT